jgi:hypothetical protein
MWLWMLVLVRWCWVLDGSLASEWQQQSQRTCHSQPLAAARVWPAARRRRTMPIFRCDLRRYFEGNRRAIPARLLAVPAI